MEQNRECGILVFRPTMEEFRDFPRYIQYMESQGAHKGGIAKVVPPKDWVPRKSYDNIDGFVIPSPISQVVTGQKGLFTQYNIQKKPMTVKDFRRLTNTAKYEPPFHESYEELERMYWKNITYNAPIYGADISGSLYDEGVDVWNIGRLNTLLDVIELDSGVRIEGVNTAYLYFGMWKTTFAWHTEDMDLYSINYVHFGAPKSWYAVPPEHGKRLERLAAGFFPNSKSTCSAFLRHKMTLISPNILKQYGIPVNKITQEAGEIIITFPYGFHAGFNHGYNCAESTNFASERWVDYGKVAEKCLCRNDMVTIDMDIFVQIFQPDKYEEWKSKKHEPKLAYNEIPLAPDLTKPFPSWMEKVVEYRKKHAEALIIKKKRTYASHRSPQKAKEHSGCSSSKSPQKQKAKSAGSQEESKANAAAASHEIATVPIELKPPGLKDVKALFSRRKPCAPKIKSQQTRFDPGQLSLSDSVKTDTRRMSSARAIASIDEMPNGGLSLKSASVKNDLHDSSAKKPKRIKSEDVTGSSRSPTKNAAKRANCSVQCEPFSSLPVEALDQKTFVIKQEAKLRRTDLVSPPTKRRHPVSKKGISKKSSSKVLLKKESHKSTDEEPVVENASKAQDTTSAAILSDSRVSFKEEREYNGAVARFPPYCAICSLFKPHCDRPQESTSTVRGLPSLTLASAAADQGDKIETLTRPLIPEVSFASSVNHPSPFATCNLLDEEGRSPLIQCCVCFLQVHASCYGVEKVPTRSPWTCARCMKRVWDAQCTLCCIRGGALKPINGGLGWAHVVCAVAIPEVYFNDTTQRNNINVSKIPLSRLKLQCVYCKDSKLNQTSGVCLQCCAGPCTVSFHTTCAHAAGIPIEPGNWPFPVYVHCHKHAMMKIDGNEGHRQPSLDVGEEVVAKNRQGKYCRGVVCQIRNANFYKVNFRDNSWSDNLYQQDIVSHDWKSEEFPKIGSTVQVKWTDGLLYDAEYRGHSVQQMIKVKFEEGSTRQLERGQVYTDIDALPQRIKKRLAKSALPVCETPNPATATSAT